MTTNVTFVLSTYDSQKRILSLLKWTYFKCKFTIVVTDVVNDNAYARKSGITRVVITFLAHLSRRLSGGLIVYPCSGVRPSVRRRRPSAFTNSKIFFSETAWPIKLKFYVEPPWVGGMKVCSRELDHMTKMAAAPIYGKTLQKSSSPS